MLTLDDPVDRVDDPRVAGGATASSPAPKSDSSHRLSTEFRPVLFGDVLTGALDIELADRRVLSLPTQLGCRVGCTFCVSSTRPLQRNLTTFELVQLGQVCLRAREGAADKPIELSFTGEGEPALNWKAVREAVSILRRRHPEISSVRTCFSGLGASRLLARLAIPDVPTRLQFSLHSATQTVRNALVPRSEPLDKILGALLSHELRFEAVELNVVLQAGVNDSMADLDALCEWGPLHWPVLLNPLLGDTAASESPRTDLFEQVLKGRGRIVRRFRKVAESICQHGVYPLLKSRDAQMAQA